MKRIFGYYSLITVSIVLMMFSCKNASEKAAEKIAEKMVENATGENVDIDYSDEKVVIETEEGTIAMDATANKWPDDVPDDVPEFDYGKITAVTTNDTEGSKGWSMAIEDVPNDAVSKYKEALKANGFKIQGAKIPGMSGMANGKKGNVVVAVISGDGSASMTIQILDE